MVIARKVIAFLLLWSPSFSLVYMYIYIFSNCLLLETFSTLYWYELLYLARYIKPRFRTELSYIKMILKTKTVFIFDWDNTKNLNRRNVYASIFEDRVYNGFVDMWPFFCYIVLYWRQMDVPNNCCRIKITIQFSNIICIIFLKRIVYSSNSWGQGYFRTWQKVRFLVFEWRFD